MKKSNKEKLDLIVCPVCGTEYFPAEIYLPNNFLGKPEDIQKTQDGKISGFYGKSMDLKESFICDNCGSKLNISARVSFKASADITTDFSTDYTTKLYNKIYISEE